MLFLNEHDLIRCLDLDLLQVYMKDALLSFSLKKTISFPRAVFQTSGDHNAPLGFMPAFDPNKNILGYKAISVFHQNTKKKINPHQGIVTLLDTETGKIKCILDAFFITAVRTAAVSAVATDLLSRTNAKTLALIGAGCQAVGFCRKKYYGRDAQEFWASLCCKSIELFKNSQVGRLVMLTFS